MPRPNRGVRLSDTVNNFGYWEVVWVEPPQQPGGKARSKRLSTGTADVEKANRVLAEFILGKKQQEERTDADRIKAGEVPIAPLLRDYWAERVKRKNVSTTTTFYNLKNIITFFCRIDTREWRWRYVEDHMTKDLPNWTRGMLVCELNDELIDDYIEARHAGEIGEECGNAGLRRELAVFAAALNHAAGKKRVSRDAIPKINLPPEPDAKDRWLRDKETETLLAACQPKPKERLTRAYRFTAIVRYLASRRRAIETLKWPQVDMETWKIQLNPRGRKQTTKRRPTLPIPKILRPVFVRAWKERLNDEWVLDHPGSVVKAFNTAVEAAGLMPAKPWLADGRQATDEEWEEYRHLAVTPHTLRHTWATRAAQNGVALWKIAGVLGDTLETVTKRYLHHCPDHLRDAVEMGMVGQPPEDLDLD